jgi:hypothetical protein
MSLSRADADRVADRVAVPVGLAVPVWLAAPVGLAVPVWLAAPAWPAAEALPVAVAGWVASLAGAVMSGAPAAAASPVSAAAPEVPAAVPDALFPVVRWDVAAGRDAQAAALAEPPAWKALRASAPGALLELGDFAARGPGAHSASVWWGAQAASVWWGAPAACGSGSLRVARQARWAVPVYRAARADSVSRLEQASPVVLRAGRGVRRPA